MSTQTMHEVPQQAEILSRIVDAMIDAQERLDGAPLDQWDRILRDSCRQRRSWASDDCAPLAGTC